MTKKTIMAPSSCPERDCGFCPRLAAFRGRNRAAFPDRFNAPVPSFGAEDPAFLVVGLAPGLKGANFSGRPFTGDYAGDLLYATLIKFGLAEGVYDRRADDGVTLRDARITNAVRCVPPENKPTPAEMKQCLPFLEREIAAFSRLRVVLALGAIAHNSVLKAFGLPAASRKFAHGAVHALTPEKTLDYPVILIDSYHCSRYNVNTGRLTENMFGDVMSTVRRTLDKARAA